MKTTITTMETTIKKTGGRKREIVLRLCVTEAEKDLIYSKMRQLKTENFGAYARKILIDGRIISRDNSDLKAVAAEMQKIGADVNLISRRINSTTRIYEKDFTELKRGIDSIWRLLRYSLLKAR